ncbi:MAG: DUF4301 family protein, partial [Muribaculaceae bacterium]|nr:DUF4301 family protein [Muribaculaceae bacterium]
MFNESDLKFLSAKGITPEQAELQLSRFKTGFPYLTLHGSATPGHGIVQLYSSLQESANTRWQQYL